MMASDTMSPFTPDLSKCALTCVPAATGSQQLGCQVHLVEALAHDVIRVCQRVRDEDCRVLRCRLPGQQTSNEFSSDHLGTIGCLVILDRLSSLRFLVLGHPPAGAFPPLRRPLAFQSVTTIALFTPL